VVSNHDTALGNQTGSTQTSDEECQVVLGSKDALLKSSNQTEPTQKVNEKALPQNNKCNTNANWSDEETLEEQADASEDNNNLKNSNPIETSESEKGNALTNGETTPSASTNKATTPTLKSILKSPYNSANKSAKKISFDPKFCRPEDLLDSTPKKILMPKNMFSIKSLRDFALLFQLNDMENDTDSDEEEDN